VAVHVRDEWERRAWIEAVSGWARTHGVTIVAPFFDESVPKNSLVVVEAEGVVFNYDKQHPGRCTGATVVRATGHGISAIFDGTGRVLACASSASGPVVLVADAPVEAGT
jgi:hypothetical protein